MPGFLEPRRISERAFAAAIQEAHINGVSARAADRLVQPALGESGIKYILNCPLRVTGILSGR